MTFGRWSFPARHHETTGVSLSGALPARASAGGASRAAGN
jgi:hypothetical protein